MEFNATFLVSIISFLIFVYLMNKVLYEPMRNIVQQRKAFVEGNFLDAENNKTEADKILNDKNNRIKVARDEAKTNYTTAVEEYKQKRSGIIDDAKSISETELQGALDNLTNVSNDAKANLRARMTDLANDIVEKMIGYHSEVQGFDEDRVNDILYR